MQQTKTEADPAKILGEGSEEDCLDMKRVCDCEHDEAGPEAVVEESLCEIPGWY